MITEERLKITKLPLFLIYVKGAIARLMIGRHDPVPDPPYLEDLLKRSQSVKTNYYKKNFEKPLTDYKLRKTRLEQSLASLNNSPNKGKRETIIKQDISIIDGKISELTEYIKNCNERVDNALLEINAAYCSGYFRKRVKITILEREDASYEVFKD